MYVNRSMKTLSKLIEDSHATTSSTLSSSNLRVAISLARLARLKANRISQNCKTDDTLHKLLTNQPIKSLKIVLGNPRGFPSVPKLHQISVKYQNFDRGFTEFLVLEIPNWEISHVLV